VDQDGDGFFGRFRARIVRCWCRTKAWSHWFDSFRIDSGPDECAIDGLKPLPLCSQIMHTAGDLWTAASKYEAALNGGVGRARGIFFSRVLGVTHTT